MKKQLKLFGLAEVNGIRKRKIGMFELEVKLFRTKLQYWLHTSDGCEIKSEVFEFKDYSESDIIEYLQMIILEFR